MPYKLTINAFDCPPKTAVPEFARRPTCTSKVPARLNLDLRLMGNLPYFMCHLLR
jgi:hypothetical protein